MKFRLNSIQSQLSQDVKAAGWAGEHAALMLNTPSLQKPLLRRLTAQARSHGVACHVSAP